MQGHWAPLRTPNPLWQAGGTGRGAVPQLGRYSVLGFFFRWLRRLGCKARGFCGLSCACKVLGFSLASGSSSCTNPYLGALERFAAQGLTSRSGSSKRFTLKLLSGLSRVWRLAWGNVANGLRLLVLLSASGGLAWLRSKRSRMTLHLVWGTRHDFEASP